MHCRYYSSALLLLTVTSTTKYFDEVLNINILCTGCTVASGGSYHALRAAAGCLWCLYDCKCMI